jgi:2-polyprenyl-6-hydroxyphenyl methylase/3-demethylubiquinone-9 3-methyltransferase
MADLTNREEHFEFGSNWLDFARGINEAHIGEAVVGLQRLFPDGALEGCRFLDIGCGSGLNMLAALRLGASEVVGVDIDENAVEAATGILRHFAPCEAWQVSRASVFELESRTRGRFDIVYSWGVLHHTGAMWEALRQATCLVNKGGLLAIALYRKTLLCGVWRWEKRLYSSSPRAAQMPWRWCYQGVCIVGLSITGRNPKAYIRDHPRKRGMSWRHDVHDWLGGYPYESAAPDEVWRALAESGFERVRYFSASSRKLGLFGTGCAEYVAYRRAAGCD